MTHASGALHTSLFASVARCRFRFVNRIPLERGLGSSASAIALGLVAEPTAAGRSLATGRAAQSKAAR